MSDCAAGGTGSSIFVTPYCFFFSGAVVVFFLCAQRVPLEIGSLSRLHTVCMDDNKIEVLPEEVMVPLLGFNLSLAVQPGIIPSISHMLVRSGNLCDCIIHFIYPCHCLLCVVHS